MFSATTKKDTFLEQTRSNREEREKKKSLEQKKDNAILLIQRNVRGWLARSTFRKKIL